MFSRRFAAGGMPWPAIVLGGIGHSDRLRELDTTTLCIHQNMIIMEMDYNGLWMIMVVQWDYNGLYHVHIHITLREALQPDKNTS